MFKRLVGTATIAAVLLLVPPALGQMSGPAWGQVVPPGGGTPMKYRGPFDVAARYNMGDIVVYGLGVYLNIQASEGVLPTDTAYWAILGVSSPDSAFLSIYHTDTTPGTPVRGDLIVAQGATPLWGRFAKGAAGTVLTMGASEPSWLSPNAALLSAVHTDTTPAAVTRGALVTGQGASPTWSLLTKGAAGTVLTMGADEPGWSPLDLTNLTPNLVTFPNTTSNTVGNLVFGTTNFVHNFGATGTAKTNVWLGGAGNFTLTGSAAGVQGSYNVGIGQALNALTTGSYNFAGGYQAGNALTSGSRDIFIGNAAGKLVTTVTDLIAIGDNAMPAKTNFGGSAIAIGSDAALQTTQASQFVAIGTQALRGQGTVGDNVGIGYQAGYSMQSGQNTFVGSQAGHSVTTYGNNTFLGFKAGYLETLMASGEVFGLNIQNSIGIGYQAQTDQSNQVALGGVGITNTKVRGDVWMNKPTAFAAESLTETDFATSVNWTTAGDFAISGAKAVWTRSGGTGSLTQLNAGMATAMKGRRLYAFQYTTSALSGSYSQATFTLTTATSNETVTLRVWPEGTYRVWFASATAPTGFVLSAASSFAGSVSFDNISLKEVNAGDLYLAGVAYPDQVNAYTSIGIQGTDWTSGSGVPAASCSVGELYTRTDGAAGTTLYSCTAVNTWTAVGGGTIPTEYVLRKAAYCYGNGTCLQTTEWDWNGLEGGLPTFSNGVASATNFKASADFSDSTDKHMQTSFVLPADWDSGQAVTLDFYWFANVADAAKDAVWQAATVCSSAGDVMTTARNAYDTVTSAASASANVLRVGTISALTMTGCAAGDTLTIDVERDGDHADDDLAATASLLAIRLGYKRTGL